MSERVSLGADIDDILDDMDTVLEPEVPQILETELDPVEFRYWGHTVVNGVPLDQYHLGEAA